MSITTYTSTKRPEETQTDYPPCCGKPPVLWTWKKKGLCALSCVSSDCPNHAGVLGYSEKDVLARWAEFRREETREWGVLFNQAVANMAPTVRKAIEGMQPAHSEDAQSFALRALLIAARVGVVGFQGARYALTWWED